MREKSDGLEAHQRATAGPRSWIEIIAWTIGSVAMAALAMVPNATLFSSFFVGVIVSVVQAMPLVLVRRRPIAAVTVVCAAALLTSVLGSDVRVPWSAASVVVGIVAVVVAAARSSDRGAAACVVAVSAVASISVFRHDMPVGYFGAGVVVLTGLVLVVRLIVRLRETSARLRDERHRRAVEEVRRMADARHSALSARVHDIVGHHLAVIALTATSEEGRASTPAEKDRALAEVASCADLALTEIRSVLDASSGHDDDRGEDSLQRLIDEWSDVGVQVDHEGLEFFDGVGTDLRRQAYQVVRQAITNTVQHGSTKAVRIVVADVGGALRLRVINTADSEEVVLGRGLSSMKTRLAENGHDLTIRTDNGLFELDVVLAKGG